MSVIPVEIMKTIRTNMPFIVLEGKIMVRVHQSIAWEGFSYF